MTKLNLLTFQRDRCGQMRDFIGPRAEVQVCAETHRIMEFFYHRIIGAVWECLDEN